MRKIIGGVFLSLDGVMQAPGRPEVDPTGSFALEKPSLAELKRQDRMTHERMTVPPSGARQPSAVRQSVMRPRKYTSYPSG